MSRTCITLALIVTGLKAPVTKFILYSSLVSFSLKRCVFEWKDETCRLEKSGTLDLGIGNKTEEERVYSLLRNRSFPYHRRSLHQSWKLCRRAHAAS